VLRGGYVGGVREVRDEVLIRGREGRQRGAKGDEEGKEKRRKRCVCM